MECSFAATNSDVNQTVNPTQISNENHGSISQPLRGTDLLLRYYHALSTYFKRSILWNFMGTYFEYVHSFYIFYFLLLLIAKSCMYVLYNFLVKRKIFFIFQSNRSQMYGKINRIHQNIDIKLCSKTSWSIRNFISQ